MSKEHKRRGCLIAIACLIASVLLAILAYRIVYSEARMGAIPICGVFMPFYECLPTKINGPIDMDNYFPNVMGSGRLSLHQVATNFGYNSERLQRDYTYVPGLRGNDPTDLVMLYMTRKTRYLWHGYSRPFVEPKWLVFSPDFGYWPTNAVCCAERGQRMGTPEFKRRLRHTLDFLRDEDRPYWTNVVLEQEAFLKTIKDD